MSDWDGIPADLRPQNEDVGILLAILMKVIEARAIYSDFDYARSLRAGERRLPHPWKSDLVRTSAFLERFRLLAIAPPQEWNTKIDRLVKHSQLLSRGIKAPALRELMEKKVHRLFYTRIETDDLRRLRRPDPLESWFVPGRPDRLIRHLRHEGPGYPWHHH